MMPLEVRLHLFLVRLWLTPWWVVSRCRRSAVAVLAVAAAAVIVAGTITAAVASPSGGCRVTWVAVHGERVHVACERA